MILVVNRHVMVQMVHTGCGGGKARYDGPYGTFPRKFSTKSVPMKFPTQLGSGPEVLQYEISYALSRLFWANFLVTSKAVHSKFPMNYLRNAFEIS